MYFNSMPYIFGFLPIVIIIYFLLNKHKLIIGGKIWLIIASVTFYAFFNPKYAPLLVLYILLNYGFYKLVQQEDEKKSKASLAVAIGINILIFLGFRYANFFIDKVSLTFCTNGLFFGKVIMPIAIGTQTLQQICFLVDSHKDKKLKYSFIDYFLFSIFFPQMIVGPIVKHSETIPQFNNLRKKLFNNKNFILGLSMFLIGFYKKGYLVAPLNETILANIQHSATMSSPEVFLFMILEYFHMYLDISSYMDMVLGSAMMLNIELPINFNSPMQAENIIEFWKRWQITFARFMRDYVFKPLKTLCNNDYKLAGATITTCLLGGIWQGASFCAVVWSIMHALGFLIHSVWKRLNIKMPHFVATAITIMFVAFSGILLRVKTIGEAGNLYYNLLGLSNFSNFEYKDFALVFSSQNDCRTWLLTPIIICVIGLILSAFKVSIEGKDLAKLVKPNLFWAFVLSIAVIEIIYFYAPPTGFIYYNF